MRKIAMTLCAGGVLLVGSLAAEAGELTGIRTVGSGLNAKVEVSADAPLTYVFFRKDPTHWALDLAKTSTGAVPATTDLAIPAATAIKVEKRQAGSMAVTRLVVAVRPGVSIDVKPSADRKHLSLSFKSGAAAAAKDDDLLGDLDASSPATKGGGKDDLDALLDAPAKPAKTPVKDDLDALLDEPVKPAAKPVAVAKKDDLADLDDDLTKPVAPAKDAAPQPAAAKTLEKELDDLKAPEPAPAKEVAAAKDLSLDKELAVAAEPAAPAKQPPAPVVPATVPVAPVVSAPASVAQVVVPDAKPAAPPAVVAAAAMPAGVDLGALTPDELGIASPEIEAPLPVTKAKAMKAMMEAAKAAEPPAQPAPVAESIPRAEEPVVAVAPAVEKAVAEPAPEKEGKTTKSQAQIGSLTVTDNAVEILVDSFSSYKAFTLMEPTRLVIDLAGAKASLKGAAAKARIPGVTAVRFSQYPDKVRIVFDLPKGELPAYKVDKLEQGVRVTFK